MEDQDRLAGLFAEYRGALPDPESSPEFMPALWARIEARRSLTVRLQHFARVFVTAAIAVCLLMGTLVLMPRSDRSQVLVGSYVDALALDHGWEFALNEPTPESNDAPQ